jgi:hypothetical protein
MAEGHNGHTPSPSVVLKLLSVPDRGAITVRFLGEMLATMTHWIPGNKQQKGHSEVCLGGDNCDAGLHKRKLSWKGYAPVEVWRAAEGDWYPGVLEITEALGHTIQDRRLLGEQWVLERCRGEFKHDEVVGHFLCIDRPAPIDTKGWVETVCFRLYRTTEILWGATDPLPGRMTLQPRKAPPPPNYQAPTLEKPATESRPQKSFKQMREEAAAQGKTI